MNNDGAGAAKAKGGDNARAISRPAGYGATMGAIHSKTRSRHHSSARPYHYVGCSGYGGNEDIVGVRPGDKST
jgi:hypothetical protein